MKVFFRVDEGVVERFFIGENDFVDEITASLLMSKINVRKVKSLNLINDC